MSLQRGERLGPYEILAKLGAGGMGEVYAALDTRLGREVAIKVLPHEEMEDAERRRAFQKEARAASALNHPNIVTIHEIDCENGIDFLVMERINGATLGDLIPTQGMEIERVTAYFAEIAAALGRAHRAGIVHRDLKPANIMVTGEGRVKVLDFGLAKLVKPLETPAVMGQAATITQAFQAPGTVTGTVEYMSPEQASGGSVDPRSDIFSLGIVMYEALAGKRPWEGPSNMAVLQGVCLREPPSLRSIRPGLPGALEAIVGKALRKLPAERYQTMEEFAAALQAFASGKQVRPRRLDRRRALLVAGGAAGIAACWLLIAPRLWKDNAGSPASTPVQVADAYQAYQEARTLLVRYDRPQSVARAIPLLEAAVRSEPGHAPFHAALSDAYVSKYSEARDPRWLKLAGTSAAAALKLNPYLAAAHISRAALDAAEGRAEAAMQSLRRALELEPNNAEARWRLASRLNAAGQTEEALAMARRAAELAPKDWRSYLSLGSVEYASGRYDKALAEFQRAQELAPDSPVLFQNMAGAYHMLDRWEDAAGALQRALEIRPTPGAYSNLGTVLYFQGRFEEAVAAFEKAIQMRPSEYLYHGNLADAYRWSAQRKDKAPASYARALELAREALKARPNDGNLRASIAAYLARSGRTAEALGELAGIAAAETRPGVFYKIAVVKELAGDRAGAFAALRKGLDSGLSFHEVDHEPEFSGLRAHPGFKPLRAYAGRRSK